MFRLIEPSSGQLINHTEGIFSRCAQQISSNYYSIQSEHNNQSYYQSKNLATYFGSVSHHQANSQTILKVHSVDVHNCGIPHLLNVPSMLFVNWPDDGSMRRNTHMLPDLQIDNKTIFCVPTEYNNIYFISVLDKTTGWPQSVTTCSQ